MLFYDCNSTRIHTGHGKKCRLIWSHQSEPTFREHFSKWIHEYWGHGIYHPWPLDGTHNEHEVLVYLALLHHNHIFVHRRVPYEQSLASNSPDGLNLPEDNGGLRECGNWLLHLVWCARRYNGESSVAAISTSLVVISIIPRVACVDSSWSVGQTGSVGKQYQVV